MHVYPPVEGMQSEVEIVHEHAEGPPVHRLIEPVHSCARRGASAHNLQGCKEEGQHMSWQSHSKDSGQGHIG